MKRVGNGSLSDCMVIMQRRHRLSTVLMLTCVLQVVFLSGDSASAGTACSQIESWDPLTSTIALKGIGPVTFVDGKACPLEKGKCRWQYAITNDQVLQPDSHFALRMLVVHRVPLTGNRDWDLVIIFECRNGSLTKVFEKAYLYGAKLNAASDAELVIQSSYWSKADGDCCPSQEKAETFRWVPEKRIYELIKTTVLK